MTPTRIIKKDWWWGGAPSFGKKIKESSTTISKRMKAKKKITFFSVICFWFSHQQPAHLVGNLYLVKNISQEKIFSSPRDAHVYTDIVLEIHLYKMVRFIVKITELSEC